MFTLDKIVWTEDETGWYDEKRFPIGIFETQQEAFDSALCHASFEADEETWNWSDFNQALTWYEEDSMGCAHGIRFQIRSL